MKKQILIADSSEEFRAELSKKIKEHSDLELIGIAEDGEQAIQMVQQLKPDILVLDLMLSKKDGIGVLKDIARMDKKPMALATSRFITDYVANAAANLGVRYLMLKPCDMNALMARLENIYKEENLQISRNNQNGMNSLDSTVTGMIHEIGVPANVKGYRYLREAIKLAVKNPDGIDEITECIYKPVALSNKSTPKRVQGAIRRAIEIAWDRGDLDTLFRYFGYTVSNTKGKPTNSEFIASLADKILLLRGESR